MNEPRHRAASRTSKRDEHHCILRSAGRTAGDRIHREPAFRWTRVPDVVVLMAAGVLLGPVFHLAKPAQFVQITHAFGTLALLLILFEGGLELNIRQTLRHFPGGLVFGIISYGLTFVLIGFVAHFGLKLPTQTQRSSAPCLAAPAAR